MNYGVSSYVHNTSVARMYLVCIAHSIVIIVHCTGHGLLPNSFTAGTTLNMRLPRLNSSY